MKYLLLTASRWLVTAWLLLLFALPALPVQAQGQAPDWQMAIGIDPAGASSSVVNATAVDAQGNIYLVGDFIGVVSFGSFTLQSTAYGDMFVAKWNTTTSEFAWARATGSSYQKSATGITVVGSSVYVVGQFSGPSTSFDNITLTNAWPTLSPSYFDVFVVKFEDTGSSARVVWAKQAGGDSNDIATGIAVSGNNVYLTGYMYSNVVRFGAITVSATTALDGFIGKLTDAGSSADFTWVRAVSSTGVDRVTGLAMAGGAIYITGSFGGPTATLGSLVVTNTANSIFGDIFIAKLTDDGPSASFVWVQKAGGSFEDGTTGISVQGANLYVTGFFVSPVARFGSITLMNASSSYDVFVAKLTDLGTSASFTWAQHLGQGTGYDIANAIQVIGSSVYLTGSFEYASAFGSQVLTSAGSNDIFVARLTDGGSSVTLDWVQQAGGPNSERATSLMALSTGVYAAGFFQADARFGLYTLGANQGNPPGGFLRAGGFLASLGEYVVTGAASRTKSVTMSLSPNPARSTTTLQLPFIPTAGSATLTLRDALGRTLRTECVALPAAGLRHELSLSSLAPGIYAVHVQAGELSATRRLVVE